MDREKVLNEYFRILKPGGSIALVENLPFNPFINLYRLNRRMSAATEPQREYVNSIKGIYRFPILIDLERISLPWSGGIIICSAWLLSFLARQRGYAFTRSLDKFVSATDVMVFKLIPSLRRYAWFSAAYFNDKRINIH
jgi:SAM-dependent methyltransferase